MKIGFWVPTFTVVTESVEAPKSICVPTAVVVVFTIGSTLAKSICIPTALELVLATILVAPSSIGVAKTSIELTAFIFCCATKSICVPTLAIVGFTKISASGWSTCVAWTKCPLFWIITFGVPWFTFWPIVVTEVVGLIPTSWFANIWLIFDVMLPIALIGWLGILKFKLGATDIEAVSYTHLTLPTSLAV